MNNNKRLQLLNAHLSIYSNNLVSGTSGNISLLSENKDYFLIKPSGIKYEELKKNQFAKVFIRKNTYEGPLKPSTDTETHKQIYLNLKNINCIIHTHSPYATAFAAALKPIKCYLTAIADEFGGDIPVGKIVDIGDEAIGKEFSKVYKNTRSQAILMGGHGVFVASETLEKCVKLAISVEECAKTICYAKMINKNLKKLPQKIIDSCWVRYSNNYGQ